MFAFGVSWVAVVSGELGDGRMVAVCCMVMVRSFFLSLSYRAAGRKSEDVVCIVCAYLRWGPVVGCVWLWVTGRLLQTASGQSLAHVA